MNTLTLDRNRVLRKMALLTALTLLLVTRCGGNHELETPLPTDGVEAPLLPGCKQLRAENGEC